MGTAGKLTRAHLAYSTPTDAPLYPSPPYTYPNADLLVIEYQTDPEAAARLLPEGVELDEPALAGLAFANYPESTLGPYGELLLYLHARYRGVKVQYAVRFYVTTDVAMAAGREQAGIPKKMGTIRFEVGAEAPRAGTTLSGSLERPAGTPVASATVELVQQVQAPSEVFHYLSLRLIPSPVAGAPPSLCELVTTQWALTPTDAWYGKPLDLKLAPPPVPDALTLLPLADPKMTALFLRGNMLVDLNPPPITPF